MFINNKNIIIIGGSEGIGKTLVENLYKNNKIVAISRNIKEDIKEYKGIRSDLSNIDSISSSLEEAMSYLKNVDIFIITAGSSIVGNFCDLNDKDILDLISLNIIGTTFAIKKIVNHMITNNTGTIICTSSISSLYPFPTNSIYGASKSYLNKLIRDISEEVKNYNIRINAVAPGIVDTPFLNKITFYDENIKDFVLSNKKIPVEGVVDVFLYLMSENSKYINGSIIEVNI